jgi:subtilase family serine protease
LLGFVAFHSLIILIGCDASIQYFVKIGAKGSWNKIAREYMKATNLTKDATPTETVRYVIPETFGETLSFQATIDAEGEAIESNEADNTSRVETYSVTNAPPPQPDLFVSGLGIKQGTLLSTNQIYQAWMSLRNSGPGTPNTGMRSQYAILGPSTGYQWQQIADDGSDANQLTPQRDQYEEMIAPAQAPGLPGTYTLRACADYQDQVQEDNEINNCAQTTFEVRQTYPDFVVSALWLREGGSIKNGTRAHPYCTVKNIGNGASPRSFLIKYEINTGVFRDNDTIEAYEVGPGMSKTENVDNDNIKLGDKGNRTYTCCVDYQGQVQESNESNNCATIGFRVR